MSDEQYMLRALDLARLGAGTVSPNPMVGCVIVLNDKIIGEGHHQKAGEAHAEVNAIASVKNSDDITDATLYVTLEPCSYFGKTPACTDLLIQSRPKRVVVASMDPNPLVSGRGIDTLRQAGIPVDFGVLETEAMALNRRFYIAMNKERPYVILKWAETADGFIAKKNYDSKWISNAKSRQLVHKWRNEEDAVLIGYRTAVHDNPALTIRHWSGKNPIRILLAKDEHFDLQAPLFHAPEKVYCLNNSLDKELKNVVFRKFDDLDKTDEILRFLLEVGISSVIIEGGAATLLKFIEQDNWDEARIFQSSAEFGDGIPAPTIDSTVDKEFSILNDRLSVIFNPKTKKYWQKNLL